MSLTDKHAGMATSSMPRNGSAEKASLCNNLTGADTSSMTGLARYPAREFPSAHHGTTHPFRCRVRVLQASARGSRSVATVTSSTSDVASLIVDPAAAIGGPRTFRSPRVRRCIASVRACGEGGEGCSGRVIPSSASGGTAEFEW